MRPFLRLFALAISGVLVGSAGPTLAAARFEIVKSFEFPAAAGAGLVAGPDGAIYGTTPVGGPANLGTVFRVEGDGTFRTLHAFDGTDGSYPEGLVAGGDGAIYGTAEGRPSVGRRIFRIDADGSFSQVHAFAGSDCCGVFVQLAVASDGALVGTTYDGGARTGTIFRIDGAGGLATLRSFDDIAGLSELVLGSDGGLYGTVFEGFDGHTFFKLDAAGTFTPLATFGVFEPHPGWSPLLLASDGLFYGTTPHFSDTRPATLFRIDGAGRVTVLHSFSLDAWPPSGTPLVEGADGAIYGVAGLTIFRVDRAGKFTDLRTFGGEDAYPSPLVLGSDGRLYGTTARVFYAITGAGDFEALHTFTQGPPPDGLVLGGDGSFYGRIGDAYSHSLDSHGILFKLDHAGTFTPLHSFHAEDGFSPSLEPLTRGGGDALYGSTREGGAADAGVLFRIDPAGDLAPVRDLADGSVLLPLVVDAAGVVYGAIRGGATGGGEVFRIGLSGALETVHSFDAGSEPSGLLLGRDGAVYGSAGLEIFRIGAGGSFTSLHSLDAGPTLMDSRADGTLYGTTGAAVFELSGGGVFTSLLQASEVGSDCGGSGVVSSSLGPLALGADGVLYAVHALACSIGEGGSVPSARLLAIDGVGAFRTIQSFGAGSSLSLPIGVGGDGSLYGANHGGTGSIFRIDAAGRFQLVHAFDGATGWGPPTQLTPGGDGALYGVTQTGSAGTLFRIDAAGSFGVLHAFAPGERAFGALVLGSDGALYGLGQGSAAQWGRVFRFSTSDGYQVLHSFSGADGALPVSPLTVGSAGALYGTTWRGGLSDAGVVYRLAFVPDCSDGIDNDGDGRSDLGADPHCANEADPNENAAPVARCRDVTLAAEAGACGAAASIDGGSSDADGHALGFDPSPAGPYELGTTRVTLRVIDPFGAEDSCSAEVTVVDETPPAIECGPPAVSRRRRAAGPSWSATDACGAAVAAATAPECFVVKKSGRRVERRCDGLALNAVGPLDLPKAKTHVTWTVSARDTTGNQASRLCETVIGRPQR